MGFSMVKRKIFLQKKMSRSPNDFYNEAEAKMNQLSLPAETRYSQAMKLYKSAALGFKNAHNFMRAGDSYRKVVDCHFHLDEQQEAGNDAIECARLYSKAPNCFPKVKEAFDIAIETLTDMGEIEDCARYLIEFAKIYETSKHLPESIDCLQKAANIYFTSGREFDSTRIDQQIGSTFVNLMKWEEASNHFAQFASRLSKYGTMSQIHDACAKAVFSKICAGGATIAGSLSEKLGNEIHTWAASKECSLAKEVLDACHARLESKVVKAADNYKQTITCDKSMNDILDNVIRKIALH